MTSGLGHRFPPGFDVGTVLDVQADDSRAFLEGQVQPAAQLDRGLDVLLLRDTPPPQAPPIPAAPAAKAPAADAMGSAAPPTTPAPAAPDAAPPAPAAGTAGSVVPPSSRAAEPAR